MLLYFSLKERVRWFFSWLYGGKARRMMPFRSLSQNLEGSNNYQNVIKVDARIKFCGFLLDFCRLRSFTFKKHKELSHCCLKRITGRLSCLEQRTVNGIIRSRCSSNCLHTMRSSYNHLNLPVKIRRYLFGDLNLRNIKSSTFWHSCTFGFVSACVVNILEL